MNDSLLVSLSSYQPTQKRRPIEDFITEAFAWLLRSQDGLGNAFVREKINSSIDAERGTLGVENLNWRTQESFPDSRPDMVVVSEDGAIAFEHKVHEEASGDQLQRHREGLQKNHGGGYVVLIASAEWHFDDTADVQITWRSVYQWLDQVVEERTEPTLIREFQTLLESRGLGPRSSITESSLRAYFPVQEAENQIRSLFRTLREREKEWEFLFEELPHLNKDMTKIKWRGRNIPTEGRLGIRFRPWEPGIFVGVIVNGDDHNVEMTNRELGPDLAVVLDVGSDGIGEMSRQEYLQSPLYRDLAERLKRNASEREWVVVDTYGRPEKGNAYHPLILKRPLAEVLRGTKSFDEQVDTTLGVLKDGIEFLLDDDRIRQVGKI